jgi:hypothetical protein
MGMVGSNEVDFAQTAERKNGKDEGGKEMGKKEAKAGFILYIRFVESVMP